MIVRNIHANEEVWNLDPICACTIKKNKQGVVFLVPGYRSSHVVEEGRMWFYLNLGYDVVTYNHPHHIPGVESLTLESLDELLLAWIKVLRFYIRKVGNTGTKEPRFIAAGFSLGAAVTIGALGLLLQREEARRRKYLWITSRSKTFSRKDHVLRYIRYLIRCYVKKEPHPRKGIVHYFSAVVGIGTAFRVAHNAAWYWRVLAPIVVFWIVRGRLPAWLKDRKVGEWHPEELSHDVEVVRFVMQHSCVYRGTTNVATAATIFYAAWNARRKVRGVAKAMAVLLIHGEDDPVAAVPFQTVKIRKAFARRGIHTVCIPQGLHDVMSGKTSIAKQTKRKIAKFLSKLQ